MKLSCIHWWSTSSGDLESEEYLFVAINLSSIIIHIQLEYLISYNWKLFTLRILSWSYNCFLRIIISYLKPYNCMQTNDYY